MRSDRSPHRRGLVGRLRTLFRLPGWFSPYLRPHRGRLGLAVLLSAGYAGLRVLEPWPLQVLIDQAVLNQKTSFLGVDPLQLAGGDRMLLVAMSAGAVVLIALLSGSLYYLQSVILAGVGQELVHDLRKDLFHQSLRLSLAFHRRTGTGDLMMRLTGDMIFLRDMILATLVTLTSQLLTLLIVLALMTAVSWRLTLGAVVRAPLLGLLLRPFRGRMGEAARKQRRREGQLAGFAEEVLLAVPVVQAFTAERTEDERFRQMARRSARAGLRAARLEAGMQRLTEVLLALGTGLVLWFGVREVLHGALTPGVLLVFLAYLRAMYKPIRGISKVTERTARATAAAERVLEILRAPRDIKDSKEAVDAPALRGTIEFDRVSFAYEDGTVALREVTFRIEAGERVALVGPTGAGKSTLFSLLLRFHKPTDGHVRIDGLRVKAYRLESLRRQMAYLPQEPFLLGRTIRENLLYGRPGATEEELMAALEAAALGDFVRALPRRLDTRLAGRGQSLSGGQKQRLAIARALLRDAPIVLLDEPTTGLDAALEEEVMSSLDRLCAGRTSLVIAHHFSTVRSSDRVIVPDGGRVVEDGTPAELLNRDSLFRYLPALQDFDASRLAEPRVVPIASVRRGEAAGRDGSHGGVLPSSERPRP